MPLFPFASLKTHSSLSEFSAILFDMDGVLVDSYDAWISADKEFLREYAVDPSGSLYAQFHGSSILGVYEILSETRNMPESYEVFRSRRVSFVNEEIYKTVSLMPGALAFLEHVTSRLPSALASASEREWVETALMQNNITHHFGAIVSATDVNGKGKPAPDIFLKAAEKLGIAPEECLVLEDSHNGILAGKRAGMIVGAYDNGRNKSQDLSPADFVFSDFSELFF